MEISAHPEPPAGWALLARELGMFYHDPRWVMGLASAFRFEPLFISARESGGGALVGGLPLLQVPGLLGGKRLVSLPFSYGAGPIARSPDAASALIVESTRLAAASGVKKVEIKQANPLWEPAPGFVRNVHYHAFRLDTSGAESDIFKRLHKSSTQRGIRKAEKAGVRVRIGTSHEDWLEMARLQERTSHRHGVPAPPRGFFLVLCRALQGAGLSDLLIAEVPERGVAAAIVIWKGPREWIYAFGAARDELLEFRPNHALLWAAIRDAATAGVVFDFGRAAPEQEGLVEFKRRWGGEPVPLAYDYWPGAGGLNVARRDRGALGAAARVWSALPAPVARVGSALYRYLG